VTRPGATRAGGITLDAVLSFMSLIWAVDHELERVSKRMEARLGLTVPQRLSLLLIGRHPGILASELASVLHLHRGTLTGIVRRLEAAGYVRKTTDARDARRVGLTLTPAGAVMNQRRAGTFESAVRELLASVSARERAVAERVLAGLSVQLRTVSDGRQRPPRHHVSRVNWPAVPRMQQSVPHTKRRDVERPSSA